MPPSQLKQLKSSLRDSGILGPQKSKKQKKAHGKDASKRIQRNAALEGIREKFNPFEVKAPSRRDKFEISSNKPIKRTIERPGVTRGLGEERRRETLLKEIQSRNKVGGMLDRRFGEDDPNMTPEQKAAERFAQQALRTNRKNTMFNLEEDQDDELQLTHGGRALDLGDRVTKLKDDFQEEISGSEAEDFDAQDDRPHKRARLGEAELEAQSGDESEQPARKKTKNEVMQEVMAKSKAYKAARQAQKDDDDDLRDELNKGMSDMFAALQNSRSVAAQLPSPPVTDSEPTLDPSRAAMLAGKSREDAEREYEANVRQLKLEARSKPTVRTIPVDEQAAQDKARLEDLERKRLRRMKGEAESSDEDLSGDETALDEDEKDRTNADDRDDAEAFGLDQPRYMPQLEVEDEDDFVMDDIIASGSDADLASDFEDDESLETEEPEDDGEDDFINGLALPAPALVTQASPSAPWETPSKDLPFTFSCPENLRELLNETKDIAANDLPMAVQRIRALYHKSLGAGNGEKLGMFAQAVVAWIPALVDGECPQYPSMQVIEQLLRHLHSLAKSQPLEVSAGFREYLRRFIGQDLSPFTPGDLILLTSISTIFPTSDLRHPVVTPAMLVLSRYLAQATMSSAYELAAGAYACTLALRYQIRSERYVPEAINFVCKSIQLLAPNHTSSAKLKETPVVLEESELRITKKLAMPPKSQIEFEKLRDHFVHKQSHDSSSTSEFSSASGDGDDTFLSADTLLTVMINLCIPLVDYYSSKSAFPELIAPLRNLLTSHLLVPANTALLHKSTYNAITALAQNFDLAVKMAYGSRKPLLLHSHRPLAIKSAYPLFSDNYNPERKQRDPDEDRAELNKLRAEHKRERKGAMRELRKDSNFVAREQLKDKKAKDEAYEKKFKRLVADIQGEEGREAKDYERQKAKRQGRF